MHRNRGITVGSRDRMTIFRDLALVETKSEYYIKLFGNLCVTLN